MAAPFANPDGILCDECDELATHLDFNEESGTSRYLCEDHVPEVAGGRTNSQHDFVR